jgi:drug/metabolite transporter (DMT)-like permease
MLFIAIAPIVFVLIWSTGWIVAKYAVPYADPLTFLAVRYACAAIVVGGFALLARAEWPKTRANMGHAMVSGVLLHALYLGGVWWAISHGVPAGISALIAAVQPLLTAALAGPIGGERLRPIQIIGIFIGFFGVLGVLAPKILGVDWNMLKTLGPALTINILAMLSVTLGTFYQKRFVASGDLRTVTTLQYVGALAVGLPLAFALEPMRFSMQLETWLALAWSVIVLSIGAIGLMLVMIRRGAVSKVAALIYLIPPTAALQAYLMFGETLTLPQIAFMILVAIGVYLATRSGAFSSEVDTGSR